MLGEGGQHVIEEADACLDISLAGAIEIDGHGDGGLAGLAVDGGGAGHGVNQGATCIREGEAPAEPLAIAGGSPSHSCSSSAYAMSHVAVSYRHSKTIMQLTALPE